MTLSVRENDKTCSLLYNLSLSYEGIVITRYSLFYSKKHGNMSAEKGGKIE
nr:MAG TPA: hypothetical protein [Bacteriophage sp.]